MGVLRSLAMLEQQRHQCHCCRMRQALTSPSWSDCMGLATGQQACGSGQCPALVLRQLVVYKLHAQGHFLHFAGCAQRNGVNKHHIIWNLPLGDLAFKKGQYFFF